jgi:predicted regulator of amino acid metabolism with ACT domain
MLRKILDAFSDSPSQQKVVRLLLENGFGISGEGRVTVNNIELSSAAVGRAAGVDRRVADLTVKRLASMPEFRPFFLHHRATPDLTDVAKNLGLSVITIFPKNAGDKNIVASAVSVLSAYDLALRQIFVTDPYLAEKPKLVIIIDGTLPPQAVDDLRRLPAVDAIII